MWPERALAWLSSMFSLAAVGLAATAISGTLAFAITQGKREIGIRMALGARTTNVLAMYAALPAGVITIGIAAGMAVFCAVIPRFNNVLYGISPTNPAILMLTAATVLLVGLAATLLASRKALNIDPAEVLRQE